MWDGSGKRVTFLFHSGGRTMIPRGCALDIFSTVKWSRPQCQRLNRKPMLGVPIGCFSNFVGGLFLLNATICFFVIYLN